MADLPSSLPSSPRRGLLAWLRYRDFATYIVARVCVTLAWQMLSVAVGWQVYHLTHDPLALGLVGLVQFLPFIFLVIPAGQVADRVDRRLVLVGAQGVAALCAGVLLWFTWTGGHPVWPIFAAMGLFGTARAFWMPTTQAFLPNLVPLEFFPKAVALNSTLTQAGVIAGPALGGLLYLLGPATVYGTALVLLVLAVSLIASVKPVGVRQPVRASRPADVFDGLRFILRQRLMLGAMSLDLFAVLLGGGAALLPLYARDILHVGPSGLGALRTAVGVGAGTTSLVLAFVPLERHAGRWMFGGVALFGLGFIVFGLSQIFWLSLAALFLVAVGDTVSVYVRHLLVQLNTPDSIRGRVSAVTSMFIGASNELGDFETGLTASWFGAVPAVVLGGVLTLLVVAVHALLFPSLRRLDRFPRGGSAGSDQH